MLRAIKPEAGEEPEGFFDLLKVKGREAGEEPEGFFDLLEVKRPEAEGESGVSSTF
jgi:hypothetical protein